MPLSCGLCNYATMLVMVFGKETDVNVSIYVFFLTSVETRCSNNCFLVSLSSSKESQA